MHGFLTVYKQLSFQIAIDKVEVQQPWILIFLYLELNSELQQMQVPKVKLNKIPDTLAAPLKTTKRVSELLSLINKVALAARAVE